MNSIERAINAVGGLSRLARALGVTPQVVTHWRTRGVPASRVLAIEAATGGRVARHELRPDLYPRDALPTRPPPRTQRRAA